MELEKAIVYDKWFESAWGRYAFRVELSHIRRVIGDIARQKVLDAGCGTGRFAGALARYGAIVTCLDIDKAMLEVAKQNVRAEFVLGDIMSLPFASGSFDVTLCIASLEFVAEVALAVKELVRVTKDGGKVIVGTLNIDSPWGFFHTGRFRRIESWKGARFLGLQEIEALLSPHGILETSYSLYAPFYFPLLQYVGPVIENVGRAIFRSHGAFRLSFLKLDKIK